MKISAIILSKNAEKTISKAIKSVLWMDEIIVVDDSSTDRTREVAQSFKKVRIFPSGKSFSHSRNIGAQKASFPWLFYLDTDEIVSEGLKKEIQKIVRENNERVGAYAIPRKNILLGKEMSFGGWSPDYVVRLIRKTSLKNWYGELHEQPRVKGAIEKTKNRIIHRTHTDLSSMIEKTNEWSEIEAKLIYNSNHPKIAPWRFLTISLREFWQRGIKKIGFLDGAIGLIEIFFQIFNKIVIYAKVWELQEKGGKNEK